MEESTGVKQAPGLWRNTDFMKLWAGETVSVFGSQITTIAIPLAAVVTLQATPGEMGVLNAAQFAPYLIVTLFAGVFVDRRRRRPIMIGTNVGRALLLALVPICYWLGMLRIEYLYVLTFMLGMLTLLFDLAYQSYLPSLITREQLVEGNSKLQATASFADVSGNGLAGLLIGWLTAPVALLVDAVSYLLSAVALLFIRKPEPPPQRQSQEQPNIWSEMSTGVRFIYKNPYLRAIASEAATYNLFNQVTWAVIMLFMTRELLFSPALIGIIMATASIGALLGALLAGSAGRRLGQGPTIVLAMVLACGAPLLIPLTAGSEAVTIVIISLSFFINGFGVLLSNIHIASIRQTITPPHMLGRATASVRFVSIGAAAFGSLLGGSLGTMIGLRGTLWIGALGCVAALAWIVFSPVPRLRHISELTLPEEKK